MNGRSLKLGPNRKMSYKTVSRKRRSFKFLTEERIAELRKIKMKKRSENKVKWAVNAYCEWRISRLESVQFDQSIFDCDLRNLVGITKENLEYSLCRFVPEVTKSKGDGPYPGKTLYQLIVAIQKFVHLNQIKWRLIHGEHFEDLRNVLDNVMKERCADNIGMVRKQADIISYEYEEAMWQKGILGEDGPDKLRATVLFLLGINLALRAVDEHYYLRRDMPDKVSQITIENNTKGVKCLVFREDTCTKTNDGGLNQMRKERKIVWVYPSSNINRCPVRLFSKYISLCPSGYVKKANLYLQSLKNPHPKQWYSREVVGLNKIKEVVKELLSSAKIDGYFTNHSLRRTEGTCLFQAGIYRKLVKEVTGHRSDAVDAYQLTSDEQREQISRVISGESGEKFTKHVVECDQNKTSTSETEKQSKSPPSCICTCERHIGLNIGQLVNETISRNIKEGTTIIKLEIELASK